MSQITTLLRSRAANDVSDEELLVAVYEELKMMARIRMFNEQAGHTLQATALVHDAWMKIGDQQ